MDLAEVMIGGFVLGVVVCIAFSHPLDWFRRAQWRSRIGRLKTELNRPRGDGGGYLRETALKLGPSATPLLIEHLEARRDRPYYTGRDAAVHVLIEIVGENGVPDVIAGVKNCYDSIISAVVRQSRDAAIPVLRRIYGMRATNPS